MQAYVTKTDFIDTFKQSHSYKNNFSYFGLVELFEYLEAFEESMGDDYQMLDFDMVGICCDFTEYKNINEFINDYPDYQEMSYTEIMAVLREETEVIEFVGEYLSTPNQESFIIRAF